jgi:hypothetical protein
MLRKIVLTSLCIVLAALIAWPLYTYNKALSLLNSYPEPLENSVITEIEVKSYWDENEPKASIDNFQNITPYWYYHWLSAAIAGDFLGIKGIDPYSNSSIMASQIAIRHMRGKSNTKNTKGMLWWHLLHASLGIHIQRNWSAKDIVVKYRAGNS